MKNFKAKILYVEDDRIDQMAFEQYVRFHGLELSYKLAGSVSEAKKILAAELFDVVVADYNLGDGNAFDLFDAITNSAPLIFVTSANDLQLAVQAVKAGAYDYLVKDLSRNYLDFLPLTVKRAYDHKRKEERLRAAETEIRRLSSALSKTNNAVFIADTSGKITWVNEGFSIMTGYSFEDVKGTSAEILQQGKKTYLSPGTESLLSLIKERKPIFYETKNYTKAGKEYWVLSSITPMLNEKGEIQEIVVIDSDISLRKKAEQDLVGALNELTNAKKQVEELMKAREQFFMNMSHEIRTPVNAIVGFADLMQQTSLSPEQEKYNGAIRISGDNLLVIINDLLDFSKIKAGKLTFEKVPLKLSQVVSTAAEILLSKAIEKNIRLSKNIDKNIPDNLTGDPTRLSQILLNLLGNAIKFTDKGEIKIEVDILTQNEKSIELMFTVSDTGIGIPEEKLNVIFNEFTQASIDTSRKYGGTGLGLAIVKQLVEMQGGKIEIKSKVDEGSVFTFNLTFGKNGEYHERGDPESKYPEKKLRPFREGLKVLVVEDNHLNQMLVEKYLTDWKCQVELAENGLIAIQKLQEKDFDIILMDIQLPEMDGYAATSHIRNKMPSSKSSTPILAMTAHAIEAEQHKCKATGMNGYISKPFNSRTLRNTMLHLLNRKV